MEIVITIKNESCESPKIKVEGIDTETESRVHVSPYARFFDASCTAWSEHSEMNLMFLRQQQEYCTEKLKSVGHLFLNEVYDALGMPRTKAGQVVGWIYDENNPVGDNCVDFDLYATRNANFVNGYESQALLDFNVDGNIWERLDNK